MAPLTAAQISYSTYETGQPWVIYRYGRTHDRWWPFWNSTRVLGWFAIDVECAICGDRSILRARIPRFGPVPINKDDSEGRHPVRVAYLAQHRHPDRQTRLTWARPLLNPAALGPETDVLDVIRRRVVNPLKGEGP